MVKFSASYQFPGTEKQLMSTDSPGSITRFRIMILDIANSSVDRNITSAGKSVAIFTFLLFFLCPRYLSGEINAVLFQFTLVIIVSVIFSLVLSATYYYGTTLSMSLPPERKTAIFGKAEAFWLVGYICCCLSRA